AGTELDLVVGGKRRRAWLPIPGRHAVQNALAAAAVGMVMGVGLDQVAEGLRSVEAPPGRMVLKRARDGGVVIDDTYNASPASVEAALSVLMSEPGRPRAAVLGDMLELGEEASGAHRQVGRAAAG